MMIISKSLRSPELNCRIYYYKLTYFSPVLLLCWNQSVDFQSKSMDRFLHNTTTKLKWVEQVLLFDGAGIK